MAHARTDELITHLAGALARAEAGPPGDLTEVDAALAELRVRFRACPPGERSALVALVTPLRARRDALAGDAVGIDPARSVHDVLTQLGIDVLRPGQQEAIEAVMSGRDAMVVMATGSGKSLCYQVPALTLGGLTVVVSPLIALIRDQYERLIGAGAPVCMLSSNQTPAESARARTAISRGDVRVVFCAPERFMQRSFLQALAGNRIDLFVIDEAHCLVDWGDNFRPEYARLAEWRDALGARSTLALTATATPRVGIEIVRRLGLRDPLMLSTGFDRPNISFDVISIGGRGAVARKWDHLMDVLCGAGAVPAIVYCGTRKETSEIAAELSERGIRAAAYHARLTADERGAAQDAFMTGAIEVICATNAFGMGVDKADVRTVVHWSLPRSLEGYYQEAGRAGRDGRPARAVLLAMNADRGRLIYFNKQSLEVADVDRLLHRLASRADRRGHVTVSHEEFDGSDADRLALAAAQRAGVIDIPPWLGGASKVSMRTVRLSPAQRAEVTVILQAAQRRAWDQYRDIVAYIDDAGCRRAAIMRHFGDRGAQQTPTVRCCDRCDPLPEPAVGLGGTGHRGSAVPMTRSGATSPANLDPADARVFVGLRDWRRMRADGKPAYTVCRDTCLADIARRRPTDHAELLAIPGIGPGFVTNYGDDVLEAVRGFGGGPGRNPGTPVPAEAAIPDPDGARLGASRPPGRG